MTRRIPSTDRTEIQRRNAMDSRLEIGDEVERLHAVVAEHETTISGLREELDLCADALRTREAEVTTAMQELARRKPDDSDARRRLTYLRMVHRLRRLVERVTPPGASLAVSTNGDDELLRYAGRPAVHLLRDRSGTYAGFNPSSDRAAIAQLEATRWQGADHFVLPETSFWWLDHYAGLAVHLERRYQLVVREDDTGAIWSLRHESAWRRLDELLSQCRSSIDGDPVVLDWHTGRDLARTFSDCKVFRPIEDRPGLPYLSGTIDVVVVPRKDTDVLREARRVASHAVAVVSPPDAEPSSEVVWRAPSSNGARVSVVVTSRRGSPVTERFLHRLVESLPHSFRGEVVAVADDDDEVAQRSRASGVPLVNVVPADSSLPFRDRVLRGARAASEDIVVVLDTTTWLMPQWLFPVVHALQHRPEVGVAGGMVLEPDGRLIMAGGTRGPHGQREGIGAGDYDISSPRYGHVRPVDFCSVPFATRRSLLVEHGTLGDPPGGDAAEAYCGHVRTAGQAVLYVPLAVAVTTSPRPRTAPCQLRGEGGRAP